MPQEPADPTIKFNPYDLSAIADIRKRHEEVKSHPVVSKQPYEPESFCSAYDLSKRPDNK